MGCPKKRLKYAHFGPCFWHDNNVFRKNELYQILPSLRKFLFKITSSCFSCQSCLTKPTNKSQECFENGMNSSFLRLNSFLTLFSFSCQKQGPKLAYFDLFLGHPMFVLLGWIYF